MSEDELAKDPPTFNPDNVWVTLDTLKDATIDEVNEDSDFVLVVGDVDIKPKHFYQYHKPKTTLNDLSTKDNHKSVDYTNSRYKHCDHCEYKTKYKCILARHMQSHIMVSKLLHCHFCSFATTRIMALQKHFLHQHKIFECKLCPYKTIIKENYTCHSREHRKYKEQLEKVEKRLERRLQTIKNRQEKMMNQPISTMQRRRESLRRVKNSYKCNKCHYVTLKRKYFRQHLLVKHGERVVRKKKLSKCEYCGYITYNSSKLKYHAQSSLKAYLLTCPDCDFESWYRCEYRQHIKVHRNKEAPKKITKSTDPLRMTSLTDSFTVQGACVVDGVKYPRVPDLHTLVYNSTKRYIINTKLQMNWKKIPVHRLFDKGTAKKDQIFKCTLCVYESRRIDFVRSHVQKHHTDDSVRPFLCMFCDFSAKSRGHMRKHNKANKSKELLHCKECPFTTNVKCLLAMHDRSHQPFKCLECTLRFRTDNQLNNHYETVHVKSKLECELCDFTTYSEKKLKRHQIRHAELQLMKETNYG